MKPTIIELGKNETDFFKEFEKSKILVELSRNGHAIVELTTTENLALASLVIIVNALSQKDISNASIMNAVKEGLIDVNCKDNNNKEEKKENDEDKSEVKEAFEKIKK